VVLSVTVQALGGYDHDGYLVLGMEVTAERATSRLLAEALEREKAAARRLEEVQRLRDEFISVASHELRTPLTSILGYLDLLEGHLDGSPAAEQVVGRVRRNAARISHLAEQLVVLAEERQVHSQRAPFDLRTAVRTAVRAAQVRAGQGDVAVDEAADPVPVCGDARELEQTVTHLVDNALKFSGPRALVRCRVGADAGKAFVEVADEGPGISQAEREHVFDEFSRGAAAHRDCAPGSGVGLSVVRRVVSRHGGEVRIGDNEPRGTVVTVLLPLLPDGAR
jgi:signal transduction histidine kinase